MKSWIKGLYYGLIVGIIFEVISFSLAHICQLILGSSPVSQCRIFVIEFHYLAELMPLSSVVWAYMASMEIVFLVFGLIGLLIGYSKGRKN